MDKQIIETADRLKFLKDRKKDLEAEIKEINAHIDIAEQFLVESMTTDELDKFTHSGTTFYMKSRLFASAVSGRKQDLMEGLKEHGYGDLVQETVNANTLASFVKEQMEAEGDLPEWLDETVNTYEKTSIGMRKA